VYSEVSKRIAGIGKMREPAWISKKAVFCIQEALLAQFGGLAGIRDKGLLDSALMRPQQLFFYEACDLFDLAAAYAEGIVKNHPFLDGNKRAGFTVCYTFLRRNGYRVDVDEVDVVVQTLALAAGEIGAQEYAVWLREASVEV